MRQYLETREIVEDPEAEGEFIRSDITGMTDAEVQQVKVAMQDIMSGKNYNLILHNCYHNETPQKACETSEI